ncbi:MAG TPA: chlorite dismutase family protein [Thermodesulfobacteriota bacterium]|nr:chlorite dismutase family protein [Thermodesulfobacteriota bacterium]
MSQEQKRQYVNYTFYKLDAGWRRLSEEEKERGRREFSEVVEGYGKKMMVFTYSTFGLRADSDFMLWRISYRLEDFEDMTSEMMRTGLGKYLCNSWSFLSMTRHSIYVGGHFHEGQEGRRVRIIPSKSKYMFIYPFVKTTQWYLLPMGDRQRMMDEHIGLGHEYPSVKINTSYSFGLDDQEFMVAFETDKPEDFMEVVMKMREQEGRKYTLRDTPIFTCVKKNINELLSIIT